MNKLEQKNAPNNLHLESKNPELTLVTKCINDYFEGMHFRDIDKLKSAFHEDARLFGYRDGTFANLSLCDWLSRVASRPIPAENGELFEMSIESIDLTGEVGIVKVRDLYMGLRFTDYLSIAKIDGCWKIVNKIFHHE